MIDGLYKRPIMLLAFLKEFETMTFIVNDHSWPMNQDLFFKT